MKVNSALLALALALPLIGAPALAQTPAATKPAAKPAATKAAAKPAAKPAAAAAANADGKTLSLGGNAGTSGPLLSRDELRACLQQEESIRTRLGQLDSDRSTLDKDKENLATDQQALRADRDAIGAWKAKIDDLGVRMKGYASRVDAWNVAATEHNDDKRVGSPRWERKRGEINAEREAIEALRKALDAEKTTLSTGAETAVRDYNAKAQALDARVTDWNSRNAKLNDASTAREVERKGWVTACADRRYREDDEKAIRAGN